MSKHSEDVTVTLTGISIDSQAGNLSPNISVNLTGEQVSTEQATFNHTKEVHSEKEKSWFTLLNILISVVLALLGFYFSPMLGGIVGITSCLVLVFGSKYAKNKRKDVTISFR